VLDENHTACLLLARVIKALISIPVCSGTKNREQKQTRKHYIPLKGMNFGVKVKAKDSTALNPVA
jgi:hypothetical protein